MGNGLIDLSHEKIVQFSVVVKDAEKTAKRFSEIFGIRWRLYALTLENMVVHNKRFANAGCNLRIAIGDFGGRSLKLVQPVAGNSSYAEFLERYGEGFYTLSFGTLINYDEIVSTLVKAGIHLEMQAEGSQGSGFTVMDTTEDLGCRIEFCGPAYAAGRNNLHFIGAVLPDGPCHVEMENPVLSGGKRVNQVGIVVRDEKKTAGKFEELLGIGNWMYAYGPPGLIHAYLNGEPVQESAMESLDVAFAMGWLGDIQIEIIRPIGLRPGGCHRRFLDKKGNGIQHLSFGIQEDFSAVVDAMKGKAGIGAEFMATIKDHGVTACYFASQGQLGGFQLEIVGKTQV